MVVRLVVVRLVVTGGCKAGGYRWFKGCSYRWLCKGLVVTCGYRWLVM